MPTCTTPPAPIAQEISSRFASSALEAPRRNDVPILSSTFSSQCHPVVVHHWHNVSSHMEIHGLGPPRSDLGYPRDIYIDTSPGNHDVYAHVGDSWRKWGGPANYSVSIIPHPLRPDLYFWCTSSTGPTWNSIDEEPPPVERNGFDQLLTTTECIAGYLRTYSTAAPAQAERDREQTSSPCREQEEIMQPTDLEKTVPAKRKKSRCDAEDDQAKKKSSSTSGISHASSSCHQTEPDHVLSFPIEQLSRTFVTPSIIDYTRSCYESSHDGQYIITFSHFWGPSPPSPGDGVPGDMFFLVSPQGHRIFIRHNVWVEWPGLHPLYSLYFVHPELLGMIAWIDGTEATWTTMSDFVSRGQKFDGFRSLPPRILLNAHDCVEVLLRKTRFGLLAPYFRDYKYFTGLGLGYAANLERLEEKNRQLEKEIFQLKQKSECTSNGASEAGETEKTDTTADASSRQILPSPRKQPQYPSTATQTFPVESLEPLMVNRSTSPIGEASSEVQLTLNPCGEHVIDGSTGRSCAASPSDLEAGGNGGSAVYGVSPLAGGDMTEGYDSKPLLASTYRVPAYQMPSDTARTTSLDHESPLGVASGCLTPIIAQNTCIHHPSLPLSPTCPSESNDVDASLPPDMDGSEAATPPQVLDLSDHPVQPALAPSSLEAVTSTGESAGQLLNCPDSAPRQPNDDTISSNVNMPHIENLDMVGLPTGIKNTVETNIEEDPVRVKNENQGSPPLSLDEECYLRIVFHASRRSGTRFCRLCLQLDVPQVVEYPLTAHSGQLLLHCETRHGETHRILAGMTTEQLTDMCEQIESSCPT